MLSKTPNGKLECSCSCGKTHFVGIGNINRTKSCGCLVRDTLLKRNTKHGLATAHKKAFNAWNSAVQRCHNPRNPRFKDYGGRGIKVCARWRANFANFLHDMGDPPPNKEIDRRKNNRGYSKGNCHWIDKRTNMNNRRTTIILTHEGETLPLSHWVQKVGIRGNVIERRLKLGWPVHKALTVPVKQ